MSYTPPNGDQVGGNIITGYTPPSGDQVGGDVDILVTPTVAPSGWTSSAFGSAVITVTASFAPSGWASSSFGAATVWNYHHFATPTGWSSSSFGTATVWNYDQYAAPSGFSGFASGTLTVYNLQQFVYPSGIAPPSGQVPNPTQVFDPTQTLYGVGAFASSQFPSTHLVAFYYRDILHSGFGIAPGAVGTQFIAHRVRTLEPPFIYTNAFGTPEVESFLNVPDTWVSSRVSTGTMVSHAIREIAHWASTPTSSVSRPTIYNRNLFLTQGGWLSLQIPPPTIFNLKQYVAAGGYYVNSPPQFIGTPSVANRNRVVWPSGFYRGLFGRRTDTFVANGARAIAPAGIDSLTWGAETFIAYRIRTVLPETWNSLRMTRWGIVYNDAFVIAPVSLGDTSVFGRPDPVLNLRRTVRQFNAMGQSAFGTAFVAPRVRYLLPRGVRPENPGFPVVRLNPQPVAPAGIAPLPFGHVVLYEFHRIAGPRSFNVYAYTRIGEPWIRNRNQTVRPQPVVRGEYGRALVVNRNQYVRPAGLNSFTQGPYLVAYRTRRILLGGIPAPTISLIHRVRKSIADPPGAQVVYPTSAYIGLESLVGVVPAPAMRHPTIYPLGWVSERFGTTRVTTNTIAPRSIVDLDRFGEALFSAAQYVFAEGIFSWDFTAQVQRPQFSPITVYAPFGDQATAQARANHPSGQPHVIGVTSGDTQWSHGGGWPWFGKPMVSTSPRYIVVGDINQRGPGVSYPAFGTAFVERRLRYIFPPPIRGPRFGPVVILNVPQFVGFNEDTPGWPDVEVFGEHTVAFPPGYPPTIAPPGLDAASFGDTHVDLFNREVAPTGIPHRGNPQQGLTDPWGTALVGYPREYTLGLGSQALWGALVIEYLNRQIQPAGWDSCTLPDELLSSFDDRMRVDQTGVQHPVPSISATSGVGVPAVSFRIRIIVVQPIRAPRHGTLTISMTVAPAGWIDTVFGDIDQWEAGTVKPHGDEMLRFPSPRLARGVTLSVGDTAAVGSPRMARKVSMSGFPPPGFDGPSVTDECGCSRRVVTVWPIQPPTTPAPVVTQ